MRFPATSPASSGVAASASTRGRLASAAPIPGEAPCVAEATSKGWEASAATSDAHPGMPPCPWDRGAVGITGRLGMQGSEGALNQNGLSQNGGHTYLPGAWCQTRGVAWHAAMALATGDAMPTPAMTTVATSSGHRAGHAAVTRRPPRTDLSHQLSSAPTTQLASNTSPTRSSRSRCEESGNPDSVPRPFGPGCGPWLPWLREAPTMEVAPGTQTHNKTMSCVLG
jgi:hypothetical protein